MEDHGFKRVFDRAQADFILKFSQEEIKEPIFIRNKRTGQIIKVIYVTRSIYSEYSLKYLNNVQLFFGIGETYNPFIDEFTVAKPKEFRRSERRARRMFKKNLKNC
jgi:hypothetical protein